jgi:hypothetical protein
MNILSQKKVVAFLTAAVATFSGSVNARTNDMTEGVDF